MDSVRARSWTASAAAPLLLCLFSSLHAQPSPQSDPAVLLKADQSQRAAWAAGWLQSDDPRKIAWGAWLARVDQQKELIPVLIQKVVEYPSSDPFPDWTGDSSHNALLAVLDALIELRANVPTGEAHKLFPEFAAQSVILLVRSPEDAQPALLDIFDRAQGNAA